MINNFGFVNDNKTESTPTWIYQGHGVSIYWTMISLYSNAIYYVTNGRIGTNVVCYPNGGVRPVINLYKSAIK